jgi:hypothetical protein
MNDVYLSLDPRSAILRPILEKEASQDRRTELLKVESRWHYSQQYCAETGGVELIEEMIGQANSARQRTILAQHARDERLHSEMFGSVVATAGLDVRANEFFENFARLLRRQVHFCEKVFVFQVITESLSLAYSRWRRRVFCSPLLRSLEDSIARDEERHLKMGHGMLKLCDRDEVVAVLNTQRRHVLVKEVSDASRAAKDSLLRAACSSDAIKEQVFPVSDLDRLVARALLTEAGRVTL